MNNKIRKASHKDTYRLASSLARAFDNDPVINWLVRKDKKRTHGMEILFQSCIADLCLRHEHVLTTEDIPEERYGTRPAHQRQARQGNLPLYLK